MRSVRRPQASTLVHFQPSCRTPSLWRATTCILNHAFSKLSISLSLLARPKESEFFQTANLFSTEPPLHLPCIFTVCKNSHQNENLVRMLRQLRRWVFAAASQLVAPPRRFATTIRIYFAVFFSDTNDQNEVRQSEFKLNWSNNKSWLSANLCVLCVFVIRSPTKRLP